MSEERVLVVVTDDVDSDALREELSSTVPEDADASSPAFALLRRVAYERRGRGTRGGWLKRAPRRPNGMRPRPRSVTPIHCRRSRTPFRARRGRDPPRPIPGRCGQPRAGAEHLGLPVRSVSLGELAGHGTSAPADFVAGRGRHPGVSRGPLAASCDHLAVDGDGLANVLRPVPRAASRAPRCPRGWRDTPRCS